MNFKNWLITEGKEDERYRLEAKSIADRIIDFIDSDKARTEGLPFTWRANGKKFGDHKIYLSSIIPEYPKLKLSFTNNYLTQYGMHSGQTVYIALPSRTREVALMPIYKTGSGIGANLVPERRGIHPAVSKFLKKPDSYNTLIHELIHYLDDVRTKGSYRKNYPDKWKGPEYYNHPAETNARIQAFIVGLDKNLTWAEVMNKFNQEDWVEEITEYKKKQAIKRIYFWFSQKDKSENQTT
jgi:hypothetical protein